MTTCREPFFFKIDGGEPVPTACSIPLERAWQGQVLIHHLGEIHGGLQGGRKQTTPHSSKSTRTPKRKAPPRILACRTSAD
jgi:hypothetical protein